MFANILHAHLASDSSKYPWLIDTYISEGYPLSWLSCTKKKKKDYCDPPAAGAWKHVMCDPAVPTCRRRHITLTASEDSIPSPSASPNMKREKKERGFVVIMKMEYVKLLFVIFPFWPFLTFLFYGRRRRRCDRQVIPPILTIIKKDIAHNCKH